MLYFQTSVFQKRTEIQSNVEVCCAVKSPVLEASGLPPHVLCWMNEDKIMQNMERLPNDIMGRIDGVLKENGVAAGNITVELMQNMITQLLETDRRERAIERERTKATQAPTTAVHLWRDGLFHRLPEDYTFPKVTVHQCWVLWWRGNAEKQIPPYRSLSCFDIPGSNKVFSEIRCMMKEIESILKEKFCIDKEQLKECDTNDLIASYRRTLEHLPRNPKKKRVRVEEWKLSTAVREMRQAKRRRTASSSSMSSADISVLHSAARQARRSRRRRR